MTLPYIHYEDHDEGIRILRSFSSKIRSNKLERIKDAHYRKLHIYTRRAKAKIEYMATGGHYPSRYIRTAEICPSGVKQPRINKRPARKGSTT